MHLRIDYIMKKKKKKKLQENIRKLNTAVHRIIHTSLLQTQVTIKPLVGKSKKISKQKRVWVLEVLERRGEATVTNQDSLSTLNFIIEIQELLGGKKKNKTKNAT